MTWKVQWCFFLPVILSLLIATVRIESYGLSFIRAITPVIDKVRVGLSAYGSGSFCREW